MMLFETLTPIPADLSRKLKLGESSPLQIDGGEFAKSIGSKKLTYFVHLLGFPTVRGGFRHSILEEIRSATHLLIAQLGLRERENRRRGGFAGIKRG